MEPGELNLVIWRGKTFDLPISLSDDNGLIDFEASYDGARMQIREDFLDTSDGAGQPLFELTSENERIVISGTTLTLHIKASDTANLSFTSGKYDIELYKQEGEEEIVDPLLYGKVKVKGEATI